MKKPGNTCAAAGDYMCEHGEYTAMKELKIAAAGLFISYICAAGAYAQQPEPSKWGLAPLPAVGYMPETSLLAGVAAVLYRNPDKGSDTDKPDTYTMLGYYTLKNQYQAALISATHFRGGVLLRTEISGSCFPSEYFGIGPDTPEAAKEKYTSVNFPAKESVLVRTAESLSAGIALDQQYQKLTKTSRGGVLAGSSVTGSKAMMNSGAGFAAEYDTRDSEMNPHRGSFIEAKMLWFGSYAGGDASFSKGTLDMRTFIPFGESTICLQFGGASVTGDIPFYYYPSLGGSQSLRGFYYGRHVDRNLVFSQAEYRFNVWKRIGMTLFAGAGEVAPGFSCFGEHIRAAGGVGFRFMLDETQKINFRLDLSYNGTEGYTYLNILEAF